MDKYLYTDEEFSRLAATVKDLSDLVKGITLRTTLKRNKAVNPTVFSYKLKKARYSQLPDEFYTFTNFDDEIKVLLVSNRGYLIAANCACIRNGTFHPPFPIVEHSERLCGFQFCYALDHNLQATSKRFVEFVFLYLAHLFGAIVQLPLELF